MTRLNSNAIKAILQEVLSKDGDFLFHSFHPRLSNFFLTKPQIREFAFQTQLFENYQRRKCNRGRTVLCIKTRGSFLPEIVK